MTAAIVDEALSDQPAGSVRTAVAGIMTAPEWSQEAWSEEGTVPNYWSSGVIDYPPTGDFPPGPPTLFAVPGTATAPRPRWRWLFYLFAVLAALSTAWTLFLVVEFLIGNAYVWLGAMIGGVWAAIWNLLAWLTWKLTKRRSIT